MSDRAIDHQWIEQHIPHQGLMCLLDRVEHWDEQEIHCIARSHAAADNPLRSGGTLGIATAIEYAAQAVAVHSALLIGDGGKLSEGFLTSARNVRWQRARLDDIDGELTVRANRLSGNDMTVLYAFVITAVTQSGDTVPLIEGRIGIFLNGATAGSLTGGFAQLSA